MPTLVLRQAAWRAPFYASTGRKYLLTLHQLAQTVDGEPVDAPRVPISVVEKDGGDKVHALHLDCSHEVFDSLGAMADRYNSIIVSFATVDLD